MTQKEAKQYRVGVQQINVGKNKDRKESYCGNVKDGVNVRNKYQMIKVLDIKILSSR